jgi:hypothetical protein
MTHFTGAIWPTGKARAAGSLRRLPDDPHRAAHRAYPGDPIRTHEMRHYP